MGSIPNLSILKGSSRTLKPNYIHRIFEEGVKINAHKNAVIFEANGNIIRHTYEELNKKTNKFARHLTQLIEDEKLARNSDGDYIIAVCMPPSDELIITLLAIWKAGAAYLPLDPAFPATRIEHIISEAKPIIVIYEQDFDSFLNTKRLCIHDLNAILSRNDLSDANLNETECVRHMRDDLAIVLYTSGSTGVPKGVRLPHKVILNRLNWQFRTFPYSSTETLGVFKTALTFVDSVSEIWGPLINGLAILVVPKDTTKDPEKLMNVLEHNKIERLVLVPSLLRSLLMYIDLQKGKNPLKSLKIWVCSGETLTVSLALDFFKYFPENEHKLCNFYGSTEIMGDVSYHIIKNDQLKYQDKVPIGIPVDNSILYLLDKDFRPVKAGDAGELFVSGLNLAAGYVNGRDPEKFLENPLAIDPTFSQLFRTGDFARIEKGALLFEGRTDSQVKIRGHRVDLSEIEKGVCSVHGVDKCVVLCYQPGEMNQALLAFVTSANLLSENQIESLLRDKLTSYMIPQVILMENIPLLVNGKIDRQALLKSYESTNNNDDSSYEPEIDYTGVPHEQMSAAKTLFETIASVLNRSARAAICLNANFYEIGGNSLNSIFTITSLNDKGFHISISDFIAAMDLGEILDRMTQTDVSTNQNTYIIMNSKPPIYRIELLADKHKADVLNMITTSFFEKADLEQWLMPDISVMDYSELMDQIWEPLVEKNFSFVSISEANNKVIGVALNFDAHDEPEVEITSKLCVIFDFLETIEGPIRDGKLPNNKGDVLHSFMMATHSSLSTKENVAVMQFLEDEVLKIAKNRDFAGILTSNTSPLTQQLGSSVYGYKTMLDYQVNKYIARDGSKPFGLAPDAQHVLVHWKTI